MEGRRGLIMATIVLSEPAGDGCTESLDATENSKSGANATLVAKAVAATAAGAEFVHEREVDDTANLDRLNPAENQRMDQMSLQWVRTLTF